jgi:hypothetical protein
MDYNKMTTKELNNRLNELYRLLNTLNPSTDEWDDIHEEYDRVCYILDERYREENEASFNAYYEEHIKGRTWEEIDPNHWDFYSDWHKDMYGYRPMSI